MSLSPNEGIIESFWVIHRTMSRKWTTVALEDIWHSPVCDYVGFLVSQNFSSIGITSEVEARLGRVTEHGFESGVSLRYFYKMKDYLASRNYWTDKEGNVITPEVEDEYSVLFEQNYRVIYIKKNGEYYLLEAIRKMNMEKETFFFDENHYSLRISLSKETPLSENEKRLYANAALAYLNGKRVNSDLRVVLVRHRERISFNFNNEYSIDMTTIQSSESLSTLSQAPTTYEVECEMGLPKHSYCESVFIFINGILRRLFSLPDSISMPPENSIFSPAIFKQIILNEHNLILLNPSSSIELLSSEGYNDELIEWCKSNNDDHLPILPYEEANQLKWSLSHPRCMHTLFGKEYDTKSNQRDALVVINQGGTIRTKNGKVFHCCVWQYEGVLRKDSVGLKRQIVE